MDYVNLGRSGLRVSRIGLGMMSFGDPATQNWALPEDAAEPILRRAVEAGITLFDTADMYSEGVSEEITGRLLRSHFPNRDEYVIATKVYYPMGMGSNERGLSRKHLLAGIDASLRRLRTEHIDLYQIHRWDDETPIEETMAALHEVVRSGKVLYVGASGLKAWQFAKAQHIARAAGWTTFVSMQSRYNLVNREEEREMIPLCLDLGVGIIPYSPLARGLLAGTHDRNSNGQTVRSSSNEHAYRPADFDVVDMVRAVALEHSRSLAQISLGWLLSKPGVSAPVIGATKLRHLDEAISALEVVLTDDERARLESSYSPHSEGEFT
jgi:aryl-alcohol dehydrogenase-like predicted oxidoreductase